MKKRKSTEYKAPCLGSVASAVKALVKMEAGLTLEHCRKCKNDCMDEENKCSILFRDAIKAYDTMTQAMSDVLVLLDEDMAFDLVNEEKPHLSVNNGTK